MTTNKISDVDTRLLMNEWTSSTLWRSQKNEKKVQGTIPGTVTAWPTLRPVFPPLPRAGECAARLPASRGTFRFNTRSYPSPSGRIPVGDSGFGVGRPSTCGQRHTQRHHVLCLRSPTQVTGGRYTARISRRPK